ncbi:hypothetical protein D3C87_1940210 [compost metagenome]
MISDDSLKFVSAPCSINSLAMVKFPVLNATCSPDCPSSFLGGATLQTVKYSLSEFISSDTLFISLFAMALKNVFMSFFVIVKDVR